MSTETAIPASKQLHGLDHLRALAILMVLLYHYRMFGHPAWLDDVIHFGWSGVDLFFVLSGYLISSQLFVTMAQGKPVSFPEFFIKRFFRIIPPYLLILSIYFLVPAFWERETLLPLWRYLTFTQNFGLNLKVFGTFSHVWSLCVEEHFYLLFPFTLFLLIRTKRVKAGGWLLFAVFMAGFAIRLFCWYRLIAPHAGQDDAWMYWYMNMYYPTYTRLDGLVVGVAIAALFTFRPVIRTRITQHGNAWLLAGLLVLTGAWFLCDTQSSFGASIFGFPVVALGYGLLVMAAVSPSCILYRDNRITALIAKVSFVLYLSHKGVIHLVQPLLAKTGMARESTLMMLLCVVIAIGAAWMIHLAVEQPMLRLRKKVLASRKVRRQPAAALQMEWQDK